MKDSDACAHIAVCELTVGVARAGAKREAYSQPGHGKQQRHQNPQAVPGTGKAASDKGGGDSKRRQGPKQRLRVQCRSRETDPGRQQCPKRRGVRSSGSGSSKQTQVIQNIRGTEGRRPPKPTLGSVSGTTAAESPEEVRGGHPNELVLAFEDKWWLWPRARGTKAATASTSSTSTDQPGQLRQQERQTCPHAQGVCTLTPLQGDHQLRRGEALAVAVATTTEAAPQVSPAV